MRSSSLPGSIVADDTLPCLALHPTGFTLPRSVTETGGGLLPHHFTLTTDESVAVCFLWHFPYSTGVELPGIPGARCPQVFGLSSLPGRNAVGKGDYPATLTNVYNGLIPDLRMVQGIN